MARSRAGRPGRGSGGGESTAFDWVEQRPVGTIVGACVLVGWAILFGFYANRLLSIEVAFFIAVALLTFGLGLLSAFAAAIHYSRRGRGARPELFRPWKRLRLVKQIDEYFRWLAPVAFTSGIIFGHFFWH